MDVKRILRGIALPVGLPVGLWILASLIFATPEHDDVAVATAGHEAPERSGESAPPQSGDIAPEQSAAGAPEQRDENAHESRVEDDDRDAVGDAATPSAEPAAADGADRTEPTTVAAVSHPEPPAAPAPERAPDPAASTPPAGDPESWLAEARQAAWEGRFADAAELYREVVNAVPDDADAWGELGNAHYRAGHWREATRAYTTASLLLIESGRSSEAAQLVPVLMQLDAPSGQMVAYRLWVGQGR